MPVKAVDLFNCSLTTLCQIKMISFALLLPPGFDLAPPKDNIYYYEQKLRSCRKILRSLSTRYTYIHIHTQIHTHSDKHLHKHTLKDYRKKDISSTPFCSPLYIMHPHPHPILPLPAPPPPLPQPF